MKQKLTKQVKYRIICTAREHLTKYNKERNKEVNNRCIQKEKFNPNLKCINHEWDTIDGVMCPYVEIRKIG